jgi:hypothetical protein
VVFDDEMVLERHSGMVVNQFLYEKVYAAAWTEDFPLDINVLLDVFVGFKMLECEVFFSQLHCHLYLSDLT